MFTTLNADGHSLATLFDLLKRIADAQEAIVNELKESTLQLSDIDNSLRIMIRNQTNFYEDDY